MRFVLSVNGSDVEVEDGGASLLEVLRDQLGLKAAKDGCSPQGQCGCCTVWIDGQARVACVTPARRAAGRSVTTLEGLDESLRRRWSQAFCESGASQCGFCTPGIVMRLAAGMATGAAAPSPHPPPARPAGLAGPDPATGQGVAGRTRSPRGVDAERALLGHLCRCTGWRTILEAAQLALGEAPSPSSRRRDLDAASRRASIEGATPQSVGTAVAEGAGGFADDTAPPGALVAVPDGAGGWAVGESLHEARRRAAKPPGRRSSQSLSYPLEVPPGDWDLTLRTTWVDPGYLETDASWCSPGGEPASALGNGGAFGGKVESLAPRAAKQLAEQHGRAVRVLLSRDDVVRLGPKRPPVAAGVKADGTGVMRVVRCHGLAERIASVAPGIVVEEVDVPGPEVSTNLRAAGWAEAAVLLAVVDRLGAAAPGARVTSPAGATADALVGEDRVDVTVSCGDPLDEVVLRSYCIGAAHMALGWVRSEGLAVDGEGAPLDLTLRSLGILAARDTPEVAVRIVDEPGPPVNGSDAVFAAVAAAAWMADGLAQDWPTRRTPVRVAP